MSFNEHLKVEIESVFDSSGFKRFRASMAKANASIERFSGKMAGAFDMGRQLRGFRRKASKMSEVLDGVLKDNNVELTGPNVPGLMRDLDSGQILGDAEVATMFANQMEKIENSTKNIPSQPFKDISGEQIPAVMGGAPDDTQGFAPRQNRRMSRLGRTFSRVRGAAIGFGASVAEVGSSLAQAAPAARSLQMRLLGLQFTMLTVAFIFGGLMASALGAVGVFKVLGNTLRFLFLPTALNVLEGALKIQSAVFDLSKEIRLLLGDIFFWTSAFAIVVGLAAALGKALVSAAGFISTVGGAISSVASLMSGGGVFSAIASALTGLLGVSLGPLLAALASLVGAGIAVFTVFKRFPGVANFVMNVLGLLANFIMGWADLIIQTFVTMAKGAINIIQGWITLLLGLATGQFDKALKGFKEFVKGLWQVFVQPMIDALKFLFNAVVGNSIIPELVNGIINWLFKLPSKALEAGKRFVNSIVRGIKGIGNGIWNAFKKVLPDFLVDALEKGGQAVKGIVKAGGDIVGKAGKTIGQVGKGITKAASDVGKGVVKAGEKAANSVGNMAKSFPDFSGGGGKQQNVQQNNINAEVQINDKEETPKESGRKFGEGLGQGLNNQQSNIGSGT